MLLLFSAAALLNVNYSYGTDVEASDLDINNQLEDSSNIKKELVPTGNSYSTAQVGDAANRVKNFIETHKTLPNFVTISNQRVPMSDFLLILSTTTIDVNDGKNGQKVQYSIQEPAHSRDQITTGTIQKSEYLNLAKDIKTQIETNSQATPFVTSSRGTLSYESLIYVYSRIAAFNWNQKTLPNFASIAPWNGQKLPDSPANAAQQETKPVATQPAPQPAPQPETNSNPNKLTAVGNSFTKAQIGEAAVRVRNFINNNGVLPNFITISGKRVEMAPFLLMMATSLDNTNKGINGAIQEFNPQKPANKPSKNIAGRINAPEYLQIANLIKSHMESTGKAPESQSTSLGILNYESMVLYYSRILSFEYQNKALANFVTVSASTIQNSVTNLGKGQLNGLQRTAGLETLARYINQNLNHRGGAATTAAGVESTGFGDCWGLSDWAAKVLSANGYTVRVVQGATSYSYNHRWLNVMINGKWTSFEPSLVTKRYGSKHYTATCSSVRDIIVTYN